MTLTLPESITLQIPDWLYDYPDTLACLRLVMLGAFDTGYFSPALQLEFRGRPVYPNGPVDPWEALAAALDRQCRLLQPPAGFDELPGFERRPWRPDTERPVYRWLGDVLAAVQAEQA